MSRVEALEELLAECGVQIAPWQRQVVEYALNPDRVQIRFKTDTASYQRGLEAAAAAANELAQRIAEKRRLEKRLRIRRMRRQYRLRQLARRRRNR